MEAYFDVALALLLAVVHSVDWLAKIMLFVLETGVSRMRLSNSLFTLPEICECAHLSLILWLQFLTITIHALPAKIYHLKCLLAHF